MKPLYHIKDTQSAIRLYEMTNKDGHQETVELRQEDLISLARFRQKVESLGNYIWLAKEEQLQKLKQYLYKATKSAELITQLGWQRDGFFAFGNGIYYNALLPSSTLIVIRIRSLSNLTTIFRHSPNSTKIPSSMSLNAASFTRRTAASPSKDFLPCL